MTRAANVSIRAPAHQAITKAADLLKAIAAAFGEQPQQSIWSALCRQVWVQHCICARIVWLATMGLKQPGEHTDARLAPAQGGHNFCLPTSRFCARPFLHSAPAALRSGSCCWHCVTVPLWPAMLWTSWACTAPWQRCCPG